MAASNLPCYFSANFQARLKNIVDWLLEIDYSSNPTQCVRFSMLPRFCASSIFCVIQ